MYVRLIYLNKVWKDQSAEHISWYFLNVTNVHTKCINLHYLDYFLSSVYNRENKTEERKIPLRLGSSGRTCMHKETCIIIIPSFFFI